MILINVIIIFISLIIIVKWLNYRSETETFIQENIYKNRQKYSVWEIKVAGVTFNNADNICRQELIKKLKNDEDIILEPYIYKNEDAIYVKNVNGQILGSIPKIAVKNLKIRLDQNLILKTTVSCINSFVNENNEEIYYLKINIFLDTNDISKL